MTKAKKVVIRNVRRPSFQFKHWPARCARCKQLLSTEESHYYGTVCEHCEIDSMYQMDDVTGWRWWRRVVFFWWRRVTA